MLLYVAAMQTCEMPFSLVALCRSVKFQELLGYQKADLCFVGGDDSHRGLGTQLRVSMHQLTVHTQHHFHLYYVHYGGAAFWYLLTPTYVIEHQWSKRLHECNSTTVLM